MSTARCAPPHSGREAVGDDLNSPVILGVNVVNVEVNDSGVGGHPGFCFPANSAKSATAPAETAGQGKWASKTSKEQHSVEVGRVGGLLAAGDGPPSSVGGVQWQEQCATAVSWS